MQVLSCWSLHTRVANKTLSELTYRCLIMLAYTRAAKKCDEPHHGILHFVKVLPREGVFRSGFDDVSVARSCSRERRGGSWNPSSFSKVAGFSRATSIRLVAETDSIARIRSLSRRCDSGSDHAFELLNIMWISSRTGWSKQPLCEQPGQSNHYAL